MKRADTRRLMRKMQKPSRRIKGAFRSGSFRKFMRGGEIRTSTADLRTSTAAPSSVSTTSAPSSVSHSFAAATPSTYVMKVKSAPINFNFSSNGLLSTLPPSFGTLAPGGTDVSTFSINLNSRYSINNLPQFLVTGYVYSNTAGYINVQRQFGVQTGTAAAQIKVGQPQNPPNQMLINGAITTLTFTNITKVNFPCTGNDTNGYALYIMITVLN